MGFSAGLEARIKVRAGPRASAFQPHWPVLLSERGVRSALGRAEETCLWRDRSVGRALVTVHLKPTARGSRRVVTAPVEVEHLIALESAWLARHISTDPRQNRAPNLDVVWGPADDKGRTWWVAPFHPNGRPYTRAMKLQSQLRQFPFVVTCDLRSYYPTLRPAVWLALLTEATGRTTTDVARAVHRLRRLAVEVRAGPVGLPIGLDLSAVTGNGVLYPLDDHLRRIFGGEGYARWTDDIARGVTGEQQAQSFVHHVASWACRRGLSLNPDKLSVVAGADFKFLGNASGTDLDAELDAPQDWDGDRFLSRPAVRALSARTRAEAASRAFEKFADTAYRLVADPRAVEQTLRNAGDPIPSELAERVVSSLADHSEKIRTVGTAGDLLLRMTETQRGMESSTALTKGLRRLSTQTSSGEHTRASAAWAMAKVGETVAPQILRDAGGFTTPSARAVGGACAYAGGRASSELWVAMGFRR